MSEDTAASETGDKRVKFHPNQQQYTKRCWFDAFLIWSASTATLAVLSLPLELVAGEGMQAPWTWALVASYTLIHWACAAWYIPRWVDGIAYEMTNEEVVVHKGVFGRVHKIVPFRTVTNVSVTRKWFDRLFFGIGAVNIQTAGSSGTAAAEERLVGLTKHEKVRDVLVRQLRRYRADTSPALGGGSAGPPSTDGEALQELITEVRAIRELLEKDE